MEEASKKHHGAGPYSTFLEMMVPPGLFGYLLGVNFLKPFSLYVPSEGQTEEPVRVLDSTFSPNEIRRESSERQTEVTAVDSYT